MHQRRQQRSGHPESVCASIRDDASLVAAILNKDRKATAEFVMRFGDSIYAYIRSRLAPRYEQAEDLVQETFLAAWESLGAYGGSGSLHSFLSTSNSGPGAFAVLFAPNGAALVSETGPMSPGLHEIVAL